MFFLCIPMFILKVKEKAKNILTFYCNSFFSLKIAQIIPFSAFLGELTSHVRKTIIFYLRRKEYMPFHEKKLLFTGKVDFLMIFCLFHCFHKKRINKKPWIFRQYTFFSKISEMTCFSTFLGVLTAFYTKPPFTSVI